jgi:hypothetical protein
VRPEEELGPGALALEDERDVGGSQVLGGEAAKGAGVEASEKLDCCGECCSSSCDDAWTGPPRVVAGACSGRPSETGEQAVAPTAPEVPAGEAEDGATSEAKNVKEPTGVRVDECERTRRLLLLARRMSAQVPRSAL